MKKVFLNFILILIIILCIYTFIFSTPIFTNDELWNFQHLYKLHNGYTLYKDINAITPPLFYYFGYIILSIFSFTIIGFRVYNLLIYGILTFIIIKIFKKLNVSSVNMPVYIAFILLFLTQNIIAGANYTILAITFFMFGMYLYISKKSNNFIQGILIFLCIFTKQNVGFFYTLTVLIYELFINKKINLIYIKNQFIKFLVFLIPTSIMFLILYLQGNIWGFFNYCFGSLLEFGESNFIFTVPPHFLLIIFISILLYIITKIFKNKIGQNINDSFFENMTTLFIFLIGSIPTTYPILNSTHFIYILPFSLIIIFYFLDELLFKELFTNKNKANIISYLIILIIIVRNMVIFFSNVENYHYYNDFSTPYRFLYIENNLYLKNEKIKDYILKQKKLGKSVVMLSYESALPMVELKLNNGRYDLFLSGNLGYNGINSSEDEIKNSQNTIYLIFSDEKDLFYQDPLEIRNFIIENLNFKGTICNYSIYEN